MDVTVVIVVFVVFDAVGVDANATGIVLHLCGVAFIVAFGLMPIKGPVQILAPF